MSIEYGSTVSVLVSSEIVSSLSDALCETFSLVRMQKSPNVCGFARKGDPSGQQVQIMALDFSDATLYVAFHSSSRSERDSILACVETHLKRNGIESEWEEL